MSLGIVIPSYSAGGYGEHFLYRCLDSIEQQSESPDEIVVSCEKEFQAQASALLSSREWRCETKLVTNPGPPGIASNSNHGLEALGSTHAWVLHQDDWIVDPDVVARIRRAISDKPDSWLVMDRLEVRRGSHIAINEYKEALPVVRRRLALGLNDVGPPSVVVWPLTRNHRFSPWLSLLIDVDLYMSLFREYGPFQHLAVTIGVEQWEGQAQRRLGKFDLASELRSMHRRRVTPRWILTPESKLAWMSRK